MVTSPGLSGFMAPASTGFSSYLGIILAFIDLYLICQVALLLVGVVPATGLARTKAWAVTLLVVVALLALQGLPGFLVSKLGSMATTQPFFF